MGHGVSKRLYVPRYIGVHMPLDLGRRLSELLLGYVSETWISQEEWEEGGMHAGLYASQNTHATRMCGFVSKCFQRGTRSWFLALGETASIGKRLAT